MCKNRNDANALCAPGSAHGSARWIQAISPRSLRLYAVERPRTGSSAGVMQGRQWQACYRTSPSAEHRLCQVQSLVDQLPSRGVRAYEVVLRARCCLPLEPKPWALSHGLSDHDFLLLLCDSPTRCVALRFRLPCSVAQRSYFRGFRGCSLAPSQVEEKTSLCLR